MFLFLESCFAHPTVMIRKFSLDKWGVKYNEDFLVSQDYELWVSLFERGAKFHNIQEVILKYRYSDTQIMKTHGSKQIALSQIIRRNALFVYYTRIKKDFPNFDSPWSLNNMDRVINDIKLDSINKALFIYYSYLSIDKNIVWKLLKLILRGDMFRMPFIFSIYILYFCLKRLNLSKF